MYGERSDNESQKVGQEQSKTGMTDEEIRADAERRKEEQERIAEEKTDTNGEVWDVIFTGVVSVWGFRSVAKELVRKIIEQVEDAEVDIKVYEWDFQRNRVYAKVEISRAIYNYVNLDTKTKDYEIHAVDEINFSTMGARQRKK